MEEGQYGGGSSGVTGLSLRYGGLLSAGWRMARRLAIAGAAVTVAPLVLLPIVVFSAVGFPFAVLLAIVVAGCTYADRVLRALLILPRSAASPPPAIPPLEFEDAQSPDESEIGGEDRSLDSRWKEMEEEEEEEAAIGGDLGIGGYEMEVTLVEMGGEKDEGVFAGYPEILVALIEREVLIEQAQGGEEAEMSAHAVIAVLTEQELVFETPSAGEDPYLDTAEETGDSAEGVVPGVVLERSIAVELSESELDPDKFTPFGELFFDAPEGVGLPLSTERVAAIAAVMEVGELAMASEDVSMEDSHVSSEYASLAEDQSSDTTEDAENRQHEEVGLQVVPGVVIHVVDVAEPVDNDEFYSEDKLLEQVLALRTILGYNTAQDLSCKEELNALYLFTGVQPPSPSVESSDLAELNNKLRFLKSVVGVR